jgi:hypothetical protein
MTAILIISRDISDMTKIFFDFGLENKGFCGELTSIATMTRILSP